jgi:hypothetical protein
MAPSPPKVNALLLSRVFLYFTSLFNKTSLGKRMGQGLQPLVALLRRALLGSVLHQVTCCLPRLFSQHFTHLLCVYILPSCFSFFLWIWMYLPICTPPVFLPPLSPQSSPTYSLSRNARRCFHFWFYFRSSNLDTLS